MQLVIRRERIKRGWTQKIVAQKLGITQTMLLRIETGQRKPSFDVLIRIEDFFGMDYRDLFNIPQRQLQETANAPDGNQA